jgi:ribosomal protein S12 methylthiotransferase accessory factor
VDAREDAGAILEQEPFDVAPGTPLDELLARATAALGSRGLMNNGLPDSPSLVDTILEIDLENFRSRIHTLIAFPACECGTRSAEALRACDSNRRPAAKSVSDQPASTTRRTNLSRLESDLVGIIGTISQKEIIPGLCVSSSNLSPPIRRSSDPVLVEGRGRTPREARSSCLGEAAERYSCFFRADEARISRTHAVIQHVAVHPHQLTLFSDRQLRHQNFGGLIPGGGENAPQSFDETLEVEWTQALRLTGPGITLIPTAYCFLGYTNPGHAAFCSADTNGCSAAKTLTEAIVRGLLELIERDACAIWWYNRIRRSAIKLESQNIGAVLELFHYCRRSLVVLDISSDLAVPVRVAISADAGGGDIKMGLGCDLDPSTAVQRAISELAQSLWGPQCGQFYNRLRGSAFDHSCEDWYQTVRMADHPYLSPANWVSDPPRARSRKTPARVLQYLLKEIKRIGLDAYVVDLTRDDLQVPCVRTIVPGLRHFWRRLAPGRLYDVPVRMRWISRSRREDELNPIPFLLAR